jgi:hypothetical protein
MENEVLSLRVKIEEQEKQLQSGRQQIELLSGMLATKSKLATEGGAFSSYFGYSSAKR